MTPSGAVRSFWILLPASLLVLSGCLYGFSGGGGLPRNLRSVAVQPFDNQTASADVQREVLEATRKIMRDRLNLREATEQKADVVVRHDRAVRSRPASGCQRRSATNIDSSTAATGRKH
jgi:outer membrane lipopolysaccharide assembly protein LptE/RlpB